jgi:ABC-type multidrug transport system fused ATPase/permease subunit
MKNLKMLFFYIGKVKWAFAATMLFVTIDIAAQVGITGFQKFIIDDVFMAKQYDLIWIYISIFISIIACRYLFFVYENHFIRKLENKMTTTLFRDMLSRLQQFPVIKLQQERTGKLVEHLTNDINSASRFALRDLPFNIQDILHAIILSIIIALISPAIFFINLIAGISFFAVGKWMSPKYAEIGKEVAESRTDLTVNTEEAISSTREVLAFHRQGWEKSRFAAYYNKYLAAIKRQFRLDTLRTYLTEPVLWSVQLMVIAYGGYLVIQDAMTIGTFVVVFHFSTQVVWVYFHVLSSAVDLSNRFVVFDRLRSVLETEPVEDGVEPLSGRIVDLRIKNMKFTYPGLETPVLQDMNLSIPLGKTIAIVGKSGGGKSTIAQIIMRSFSPDEGQIYVNGRPLKDIRRSDWFSRVSIVFQDSYLFPESIETNLLMGSATTRDEMEQVCRMMQIHETIQSFPNGYQTEIGERGIQLSGGQRQRIVIVRAMLRNTEILILDEATSALDYETERQVYRNLKALREGKTTIIIAHRLSTVQDADMIYVMDHGRIAEQGTHDELMGRGRVYSKLVAAGE